MNRIMRPFVFILLLATVLFIGACSKSAENEHLPEYCQTYSGFTSVASKDFYDILRENDIEVRRSNYIQAISAISLEFSEDDPNKEIDLSGIQCFQNLTNLNLVGRSFKDLSPISALTNIQSIELTGTSVVSIDSFSGLSKIKSLVISDTRTLQSVDGVEEMTKLTNLDLSNNGIVNIDGLNNLVNLRTLYLNDNDIITFPAINQLEELLYLDISDNSIDTIEDLSGLTKLLELNAQNNNIEDLDSFGDLDSIRVLNLSNNNLGEGGDSPNFDSLEFATSLEELYLDNNGLESIDGLDGLDLSLEKLHINDNNLTDLSPIKDYTGITELVIKNNNLSSIDELDGMTGLTEIDLSNNTITSFETLLVIPNLENIDLSNNEITEIPDISAAWPTLSSLNLHSNQLEDTSGVEGHQTLEELILYNNGLTELEGISNLPNLDTLVIFDEEAEAELGLLFQNPNEIEIIRNSFNDVPSLTLHTLNVFDFGFEVEDNLQIIGSISGLTDIATLDFTDMNIDHIDENSINLPNVSVIRVSDNNITSIAFILGNPSLQQLFVDNNQIDDLHVISGFETTDLDNLSDIDASNITGNNVLENAFIELPSLENVDLSNTSIESITNCFNDLSSLELLSIDADDIEFIDDSFNNLFATYDEVNDISFDSGKIGRISNSFNNGEYDQMAILNQNSPLGTTIITGSFNNITVQHASGLIINNSSFATVEDSFNGITTGILAITNSEVETITNVFVGTSVTDTLTLVNNLIEEVPSLNQITTVETVLLSGNVLTTLDFIDAIPDITVLDISNQTDENTSSYTLESIDGVNNMPTLTTFTFSNIGVTSIDGLQNIGIEDFELSYTQNNNIPLLTVSATSFTGTDIDYLDLGEHRIADVSFLSNFASIESLFIGVDSADLSGFQGIDLEDVVTTLVITSEQNTSDFSYLADYDLVENLTIQSDAIDTLNNFTGLDALSVLTLDYENIETITNSFNSFDALTITDNYLTTNFTNLDTITSSFDIYGDLAHAFNVSIIIEGGYIITDSFSNVLEVDVTSNNGDLVPLFDGLSFDLVETMTFEDGGYDDFAFLNAYTALQTVTIDSLQENITGVVNAQIETITIGNASSSVDTITMDVSSTSLLVFSGFAVTDLTITSNISDYDITATNADIVLNSTNTQVVLTADVNDFELNSTTITNVALSSYETNNSTFNTELLNVLSRLTTTEVNATNFDLYTDQAVIQVSLNTDTLIIHDDFATGYVIDVEDNDVVINNTQTDLDFNITADLLTVSYNTLEDVIIDGDLNTVVIDSTVLDSFDANDVSISGSTLTSSTTSLSIVGSTLTGIIVNNNTIESLTTNTPSGSIILNTTNNQPLTVNTNANVLNSVAPNIPSVTFDDLSDLGTYDALDNDALASIVYGNGTVSNINVETLETTFTITGATASNIDLDQAEYSNLTINSPLSDLVVNTSAPVLTMDINANDVDLLDNDLATLNLTATNDVTNITVTGQNDFTTLNSNNADIDVLSLQTAQSVINIDAVNALATTLEGDLITDVTANVGTNDIDVVSINDAVLALDIIATNFTLDSDAPTLNIDNATSVTQLDADTNSLALINGGTATITGLNVINSSADVDINGSGIGSITIDDSLDTLDVVADTSTTLDVTSTSFNGIEITTNTDNATISAINDSTISGGELATINFTLGANNLDITADKLALSLAISGTADVVTIYGTDIDALSIDASTNLNDLVLNNLDVSTLDFTVGEVDGLTITSAESTLNITGDELTDIDIDASNLTTLDINAAAASDILINANQASLDIDGAVDVTTIINNSLTSLNMDDYTTESLDLTANQSTLLISGTVDTNVIANDALTSLDLTGLTATSLDLSTDQASLAITGDIDTNVITNDSLTNLNLTGYTASTLDLTANQASLTISGNVATNTITNNTLTNLDLSSLTATSLDLTANQSSLTISGNVATNVISNDALTNLNLSGLTASSLNLTADQASLTITGSVADNTITNNSLTNLNLSGYTASTLDLNADAASLTISGSISDTTVNNDTMTSLNMSGFSADDLDVNANNLVALDTGSNVSTTLTIITTEATFDLDTDTPTVNYTGGTNNTLDITSDGTTTLNANSQTLDLAITVVDLEVNGTNVNNINGSAVAILMFSDATGTLTTDVSVTNTFLIASNGVTTIDITGANTIGTLDIESSSVTTIDTNNVGITNLELDHTSNNVAVTTLSENLVLLASTSTNMNVTYEGTNPLDLRLNTFGGLTDYGSVTVSMPSATNLDITGAVTNLTIDATSLTTIDTNQMSVSNQFTMDGTGYVDLDFLDVDIITSVSTIEMDSLLVANIEAIITVLDGTTINLISPITSTDVFNFYRDEEIAVLEAAEGVQGPRYQAFRTTAINNAWAEILLNEYMDHLDETATKAEIDAQVYQSVDDYYNSYLADAGLTEGDLTAQEIIDIKAAIQATLDNSLLTIVEQDLEDQVDAEILGEAETHATNEQALDTFTIS